MRQGMKFRNTCSASRITVIAILTSPFILLASSWLLELIVQTGERAVQLLVERLDLRATN